MAFHQESPCIRRCVGHRFCHDIGQLCGTGCPVGHDGHLAELKLCRLGVEGQRLFLQRPEHRIGGVGVDDIVDLGAETVDIQMEPRLLRGFQPLRCSLDMTLSVAEHKTFVGDCPQRHVAAGDKHITSQPGTDISTRCTYQTLLVDQRRVADDVIGRFRPDDRFMFHQ